MEITKIHKIRFLCKICRIQYVCETSAKTKKELQNSKKLKYQKSRKTQKSGVRPRGFPPLPTLNPGKTYIFELFGFRIVCQEKRLGHASIFKRLIIKSRVFSCIFDMFCHLNMELVRGSGVPLGAPLWMTSMSKFAILNSAAAEQFHVQMGK